MSVVISIDVGTTRVKVIAFSKNGKIVAISDREVSQIYPEP